jgi:ribokinase
MPSNDPPRICVVGSTITDVIATVTRLPRPGETVAGSRAVLAFGGKGANQAVMAAVLGADVTMVSRVGDDAFGRDHLANFRRHGIDTTHVGVSATASTGVASIWVEEGTGANAIVVVPAANDELAVADVEAASAAIEQADVVVCQWEIPVDCVIAALRIARAAGVRTVCNPAPARGALPAAVYSLSDFFCPNETEAAVLAGRAVSTLDEAASAARAFSARGHGTAIVTLGAGGALVAGPSGVRHHPAPVVPVVDTTGAGDAFVGAFAVAIARGLPVDDAVVDAIARASASVQRPGTQTSYA